MYIQIEAFIPAHLKVLNLNKDFVDLHDPNTNVIISIEISRIRTLPAPPKRKKRPAEGLWDSRQTMIEADPVCPTPMATFYADDIIPADAFEPDDHVA